MLRLRPYQRECIDALFTAWKDVQRPAAVLATGLGKTVIFSHLVKEYREKVGLRVVILVHRDELADQTLAKLRAVAPRLNVGKVKAGDDDVDADVMVCSVQTLARESRMSRLLDTEQALGKIGLVIVDECHHALAVSYRNIMAALGCYSGDQTRVPGEYDVVAAGFTATMARGDGQGLGDVWQDVPYVRSVLWGIRNGYLTDVRAHQVDLDGLDLGAVRKSGGDYTAKSLGDALLAAHAPEAVHQVLSEHAADRRSIIVFTPTVAVAQETVAHMTGRGTAADPVHGGTPREDRLKIYERFRRGTLRVLVNCMVLTEGADFPFADCAMIARPTRSDTLFIQMAGRVLRPSPQTGKADALLLLLGGQGGSIRTLVDLDPGVVVPAADGESLEEAFERQEQIREEIDARRARQEASRPKAFRISTKAVDLFSSSPAYQWLRTPGGVQFIPLGGNGLLALWPSREGDGLWDVAHVPEQPTKPWERLHEGQELCAAMAWAESEADEMSYLNTGKSASWRRKPVSPRLRGFARSYGVQIGDDMRAGEASDLVAVAQASRKVDRFIPRS
jgi:superfamily II DNA or RNA helicase